MCYSLTCAVSFGFDLLTCGRGATSRSRRLETDILVLESQKDLSELIERGTLPKLVVDSFVSSRLVAEAKSSGLSPENLRWRATTNNWGVLLGTYPNF
jgi:hypothetical protein